MSFQYRASLRSFTALAIGLCLPALLAFGAAPRAAAAATYYVSTGGNDSNAGTSWATAKQHVQAGVNAASSGDQVWVRQGTYTENITATDGVAVYGGFAGTETSLSQRNIAADPTVLDGSSNGAVYTIPGSAVNTNTVDGFTVQHGNSSFGGGIDDPSSDLLAVANCTFTSNTASTGGGGMSFSAATIVNSTFTGNSAGGYGGGISFGGPATILDCTFTGNSSGHDGGGADGVGSATFTGCTFTNNSAADNGGGVFDNSNFTITRCTFSGNAPCAVYSFNTAPSYSLILKDSLIVGAGSMASGPDGIDLFIRGNAVNSYATIANNTIVNTNIGININTTGGAVSVANNIFYANNGGLNDSGGVSVTSSHNDVFGNTGYGYSGVAADPSDLTVNPQFVSADSGNYHLGSGSPLISAGDQNYIASGDEDLDGAPRSLPPSIGAYEGSAKTATKIIVANISGTAGQSVTLSATLSAASGGLNGKTLTFTVDGASGSATTNSSGTASLAYTIPTSDSAGSHTITVSFTGDSIDATSSGTGALTVSAVTYTYQVRYFPRIGKEGRMVGGRFQGSNDNTNWTTLYTVTQTPGDAYTNAPTSADPATFRYLRYLAPNGSYGNVAEIEFDSHGTKLTGVAVFGTPGSYNNDGYTFQNALDGNTSTYFDAPAPGNGDFFGIDRGATGPTYTKLTGTDYGTSGSYDNDGLTFQNAFDGNLNTYFDAPAPGNGDTVGIDLGASNQKVVTRIDFCPRSGYASRMVGGVFQGSNGHGVWTNLYTVSSAPASDVLTRVTISNSTAYRYLQYVAPNGSYGNVAEVEFDTSP